MYCNDKIRIYWIRHGFSIANMYKKLGQKIRQSTTLDPHLTYYARWYSILAGTKLIEQIKKNKKKTISCVYSSYMKRATETAIWMFWEAGCRHFNQLPFISEQNNQIIEFVGPYLKFGDDNRIDPNDSSVYVPTKMNMKQTRTQRRKRTRSQQRTNKIRGGEKRTRNQRSIGNLICDLHTYRSRNRTQIKNQDNTNRCHDTNFRISNRMHSTRTLKYRGGISDAPKAKTPDLLEAKKIISKRLMKKLGIGAKEIPKASSNSMNVIRMTDASKTDKEQEIPDWNEFQQFLIKHRNVLTPSFIDDNVRCFIIVSHSHFLTHNVNCIEKIANNQCFKVDYTIDEKHKKLIEQTDYTTFVHEQPSDLNHDEIDVEIEIDTKSNAPHPLLKTQFSDTIKRPIHMYDVQKKVLNASESI